MNEADRRSWNDFWARSSSAGQRTGCLPEGWAPIEQAQKQVWTNFIQQSRKGARVLDLATGDARVLRWLQKARPDLKLTGVDAASKLPTPPKGCKLRAGVVMEQLPFKDSSFDVVTSQFGFEYGDTAKAAAEVQRVLVPGGRVGLVIHRGDGPILAHNLRRLEAISWALEDRKVVQIALNTLAFSGAAQLLPAQLNGIAAEGARLYGPRSPAWEIPEAIRQTMVLGLQRDPHSIAATLEVLQERASNEIGRIKSLQRACATADERVGLLNHLEGVGLRQQETKPISDAQGTVFADQIILQQRP